MKGIKNNGTIKINVSDISITTSRPEFDEDADLVKHDFTECCESLNVTSKCMGFCTIHNIMDGTTGIEPESCEKDFPRIVRCMADGRNHLPCCEKQKIPDLCQVKYSHECGSIANDLFLLPTN